MPKCGECAAFVPQIVEGTCGVRGTNAAFDSCVDFKPLPKPLEDELAEVLEAITKSMKSNWLNIGMLPGDFNQQRRAAGDLVSRAHALIARHKKERG